MTADNADDLEPTIFSAMLTPHRSLGRVGFLVLMSLFGGVSFVTGMFFWYGRLAGVRLFRPRRAAALLGVPAQLPRTPQAYEEVTVTPSALKVRKVSHRGRAREWVLNPLWVRLDKVEHEEFGIDRLFLVSRGKKLAIASFLGPDEKASSPRRSETRSPKPGAARRGPCSNSQKSGGRAAWRRPR